MYIFTYQITDTGYRIFKDGELVLVQEGLYAHVYHGATIEESAQNHINAIMADQAAAEAAAQQPTIEERISALEAAQLAALGV